MIVGDMEIRLRADIARLQRDMDAARRTVSDATAGMSRAADAAKAALAGIGLGMGMSQVIAMSDQYAKFTAQLRLATESTREYGIAYADVKRIATAAQADIAATGTLYARIANGTRELGISQQKVADIVESVNLALKVSGATTQESASAILQLSQAFGSGALRGEEFNAVNEAAPRLMKALADGMGVPVGALRQMASDGLITSKVMADVLPAALAKLQGESKEVQTIAGAFQVLKNNVMEFSGVQSQANGTVAVLTGGIGLLANNLTLLMGTITTLAAVKIGSMLDVWVTKTYQQVTANSALMASNLATAESHVVATGATAMLTTARVAELRAAVLAAEGEVALAITTNGLIPAQARAAAAAEAHAAALAAQSTAMAAASVAGGVLRGTLAFLGGPIGAVIMVLGIAATAWAVWGQSSKEASEKAKTAVDESTAEMIARLDKQIEKLKERNALLNAKPEVKGANQADVDGLARAYKNLNDARNNVGEFGGKPTELRDMMERIFLRQYTEALGKVKDVQKLVADAAAGTKAEEFKKWFGENGTAAQKLAYELEGLRKKYGELPPAMEAAVRAKYADKGAATALKQEQTAYKALMTSIEEKIAANALEKAGYASLSDAQKMTIKLDAEIATGKNKLSKEDVASARAKIEIVRVEDLALERSKAMAKIQAEYAAQIGNSVDEANKEAKTNEDLVRTFGMTKSAIEFLAISRMEDRLERLRGIDMADDEVAALELVIAAKKRSAGAAATIEGLEEQKRVWASIDQTAHDTFVSIFDSGKSAFDRLRDTLKNGLLDLLYQMTIKKWIFNIGASVGMTGATTAAQAGMSAVTSGMGSAIGTGLGVGGTIGAVGMGAMQTAGAIMTGQIGMGATLSAGMSALGTGTASGMMAGMSSIVGALGPIALGIGAAVAIWKKFDTGGTEHTGGAASASSAGVSAIDSSPIGFHLPQRSAEADKMTAALAGGIVNILDSTALAFGKTAGYTAATAFADDSSKDGAWGALLINKLGEKVVNWQDTQTSRWAPKEFSDGAAGQAEYLAALSTSVRTALNGIGLPDWAKSMLDGVGAGAGIEDIAKVVDSINATQRALVIMGNSLTGFAQLGDKATSALIAASGGIDALAGNASAYYDNFYRDGEKSAGTVKQISDALAAVNIAMPATRDGYRAQVEAQMALGEAGAPAVATMLKWSGAFAQVVPQLEAAADVAKSAADILSERNDLQKQLDQLMMSSTQLLTKQRNALDASNRGLFDQIQAAQKLKDAQDAAKTSLGDTITKMKSFADATKAYGSGLVTGSLSTLTPMQQYAEMRKQLDANIAASKKGDAAAQGNYQSLATAFLTASQKINGGDSQYSSDFAGVLQTSDEMAKWAAGQVDVAQASLDALNAQVIGMDQLNAAMLSVSQGITDLPGALSVAPINPANYGNSDSMGLLVTEIKSLNAKIDTQNTIIEGLRADANKNTGNGIVANDQSQQANANAIVTGVTGAIRAAAVNKSFELE